MGINTYANEQINSIKEKCEIIRPLVVIRCLTYNHKAYIRDALEGFVMQKTDFPFVAIVHDDASTDKTTEIIKEYAEKYPDIILPIYEKENQYSKKNGSLGNIINTACKVTGAKYVAMCEGDDYWTDPDKLQRQVDILEENPQILYTCHRYMVQNENNPSLTSAKNKYLEEYPDEDGFEFDLQYAFKNDWVSKTLTSLFRIEGLEYKELRSCSMFRDTHMVYQILSRGNGYCFNFIGGVYRKQESGTWSQLDNTHKLYNEIQTWKEINEALPSDFARQKIKRYYVLYVIESLKNKHYNLISNLSDLLMLISVPYEYLMIRKEYKGKYELKRIRKINKENKLIGK